MAFPPYTVLYTVLYTCGNTFLPCQVLFCFFQAASHLNFHGIKLEIHRNDVMVVAVPVAGFIELAAQWNQRPLMVRSKIRIALVGRDGSVMGLENLRF